jgi:hypothetical protein
MRRAHYEPGRKGEREGITSHNNVLKDYFCHHCGIVWLLHPVSEEAGPKPRGST